MVILNIGLELVIVIQRESSKSLKGIGIISMNSKKLQTKPRDLVVCHTTSSTLHSYYGQCDF